MARRHIKSKNPDVRVPQTEPVFDGPLGEQTPVRDSKIMVEYRPEQFNSIIRNVKNRTVQFAKEVSHETFYALRRLRVARDLSKAPAGKPEGSDHFEMAAFRNWCVSIRKTDSVAIEQLIAIDATAVVKRDS